ncbi:MAG: LPS export ABC transporter permease LptF [Gammaproteobacteria bacterium]|jgi:lipopolysaccharide export system permease protein|nr:LPS export ABC transporter permease LptF [Gammaproteobacteria bacterium]
MKILDRYVLREAARTWAAVTAVLLFILLSNQFARVLGDAAKDKLPRDAVFSVIGLTALQYLTILIPFGLFLAIMLALARLYRDSEMPAMMACRMGPGSLYRPLAWLAVPLALLVGWLSLDLGPQALREVQRIAAAAEQRVDLSAIEPGRFTSAGKGDAVIYAERVDRDGSLTNVFLQRRAGGALEVVLAEKGSQRPSADPGTRYIVLENGRRYEGRPGERQFRIVEFAEHGIPYKVPAPREPDFDAEARSTEELLASSDLQAAAELQWRVSVPISALLLAFLAVPLAKSRPRQGRYGKMLAGVLVYFIYFNLLGAAQVWVEQGELAPSIGMWWVHALILLLGIVLLGAQNGWFWRLVPRSRA